MNQHVDCSARGLGTGLLLFLILSSALPAGELIAVGKLSGSERDRSGLKGELSQGLPHDRLGGFSAIDYTGKGHRYCVLADRGPGDGSYPYFCRVHYVDLDVIAGPPGQVKISLVSTTLLRDEQQHPLLGAATAFNSVRPADGRRFDPEGARLGESGELYVSDEYGPTVARFGRDGIRERFFPLSSRFLISHPSGSKAGETVGNRSGRQANKGMEGLAITPSRQKLVGALQGPLIQDSVEVANGKRRGTNVRLVEIDLKSGGIREFVYTLDAPKNSISEILAISDTDFLVIERDGVGGRDARFKKIMKISLGGATDISGIDALPPEQLPQGITAAHKSVLIDLLDPRHGLAGNSFPEKVEGLAFGPTLQDGRRLLIVCVDNDYVAEMPTSIYAFAIDRASLPNYGWQH